MRKVFGAVLIIIIIFLMTILFTDFFVFQSIMADKDVYFQGENVKISYSSYGAGMWHSCGGPYLTLYKLEDGEWKNVKYQLLGPNYVCLNGTVRRETGAMMCDVVMYGWEFVSESHEYEWDMKFFQGEERMCGNQTYIHHEKADAPAGTYNVKYGMAEAIFSIQ